MAATQENWQSTRPTIRERSMFMFNNELLSDVKFVVRKMSDCGSETKVIPAHKFVLSISSPVFLAMFHGEMAETGDSVELPDCEFDGLLELFRYMYSDEVNLTGGNVLQVWYLANKYMLPFLADKCAEYLRENLDPSNALGVLPLAQNFEETDLVDRCWEYLRENMGPSNAFAILPLAQKSDKSYLVNKCWKEIYRHTEEALQSDGFVTLEKSMVESVVRSDMLNVTEVKLFKAVDRWATRESERQGLTPDDTIKRQILGEEIVKNIRFPLMSFVEFASVVPGCNILTMNEISQLLKYYANVASPLQFLQSPRGRSDGVLTPFTMPNG